MAGNTVLMTWMTPLKRSRRAKKATQSLAEKLAGGSDVACERSGVYLMV